MLCSHDKTTKALAAAGVPVVGERVVDDVTDAAATVDELGVPVALKLVSPAVVHKADVGAVVLDVRGPEAARAAATRLGELGDRLAPDGGWRILVQEMAVPVATEVFVGVKRDPVFGPIIVVGAGGTLVELLDDRAIATCPVTPREAEGFLRSTVLGRVLGGYRGARDALAQVAGVVAAASRLPETVPDLLEADLNPLVVTERGPVVVDARIAVSEVPAAVSGPTRGDRARDLDALFEPRSILVVGASAKEVLPANRVLGYLRRHGYPGTVTVVHPSAEEVGGYPTVASVDELAPGSVDLACIAVAAASCPDVLEQCGALGARAAAVLSSGFSEVGQAALEEELLTAARRHRMALCGPNSAGVISPASRVQVSFIQSQDLMATPAGGVAVVAQSGALGGSIVSQAWERGIGISRFVSVGNQADLTVDDYLDHLARDPATRTIAIVLEGVRDGRRLLASVERTVRSGTAVLVIKSGRTEVGARAVQSHTGSVAGDYTVYRALLQRAGAVVVDTLTELLDALEVSRSAARIPRASRMAVVSTSGGAGSLTADLGAQYGFVTPTLSPAVQAGLAEVLPSYASFANPVDLTARVTTDPGIFGRTLDLLLGSGEVDVVAVTITNVADPMAEQIAGALIERCRAATPIIVSWTIAAELAPRGLGMLRAAGVPVFSDPARALRAVSLLPAGSPECPAGSPECPAGSPV